MTKEPLTVLGHAVAAEALVIFAILCAIAFNSGSIAVFIERIF